jgi:rubrerythrin
MAYEQVETVLKHACTFHENVSALYHRLANRVEQERVRMLLNSMSEHEKLRAHVLKNFIEDASQEVMHTWLTSSADSMALLKGLDQDIDHDASVDELLQLGLELNDGLIKVYQELAIRGEPEAVRELFQSFLQEEQQEERQLTRQALWSLDI